MAERTLVLLKPDTVQRGIAGKVISRLEDRGLKIVGMKLMRMDMDLAKRHIVAMAIEGKNAIELVRATVGATDPQVAAPGTIRGDMALDIGRNLIHGSDSAEAAARELAIFFSDDELFDYERESETWITES